MSSLTACMTSSSSDGRPACREPERAIAEAVSFLHLRSATIHEGMVDGDDIIFSRKSGYGVSSFTTITVRTPIYKRQA